MRRVLHLVKGGDPTLPRTTVAQQHAAGDAVTIVLLHGATPPEVPPDVRVLRVPEDAGYDDLVDLIFASDQVVSW
jgi:hypothetical protein